MPRQSCLHSTTVLTAATAEMRLFPWASQAWGTEQVWEGRPAMTEPASKGSSRAGKYNIAS